MKDTFLKQINESQIQTTNEMNSIIKQMNDAKNENMINEQKLLDYTSLVEEEKRNWKDEKNTILRNEKIKFQKIERRITNLQKKVGNIHNKNKMYENENNILQSKLMKLNEVNDLAIMNLKDEYNSQIIKLQSNIQNTKDINANLKKQLINLRVKYEGCMNTSHTNTSNSNKMLLRLENQLKEVTEVLQAKINDVKNLKSR